MLENPIPCKHATDYETGQGKHVTWNESGICNPCRRIIDRFISRGKGLEVLSEPPSEQE